FNFIKNVLENPLNVGSFIEQIETELYKGAIYPYLYLWPEDGQGWSGVKVLESKDVIPVGAAFWVRSDSLFESTTITFRSETYVSDEPVQSPADDEEFFSEIGIRISSGILQRNISLNLV